MAKLHRDTRSTYQRLRFDMDSGGRFLVAGDEHGLIRVWTWSSIFARGRESMHAIKPIYEWRAHNGMFDYLITFCILMKKMLWGACSSTHLIPIVLSALVEHVIGTITMTLHQDRHLTNKMQKFGIWI